MDLKEQLKEDLKTSLKERDELKTGTLRMLMAAITNKEKEGKEVADEQLQDVVATEAKKRRESMAAFEKGGRADLAEKEKQELKVLLSYLPEQLTEDQIKTLVKEAIQKTGAASQKDMGKVMRELASEVKGRTDGSQVANIVKEQLSS